MPAKPKKKAAAKAESQASVDDSTPFVRAMVVTFTLLSIIFAIMAFARYYLGV